MRFKLGDKVRVREDYYAPYLHSIEGEVVQLDPEDDSLEYLVQLPIEEELRWFGERHLEPADASPEAQQTFTAEDIKAAFQAGYNYADGFEVPFSVWLDKYTDPARREAEQRVRDAEQALEVARKALAELDAQ